MDEYQYKQPLVTAHPVLNDDRASLKDAVFAEAVLVDGSGAPKARACRDPLFALLFVVNLIALNVFAFGYGVPSLMHAGDSNGSSSDGGDASASNDDGIKVDGSLGGVLAGTALFALVLCAGWMRWALVDPDSLLRVSFKAWIALYVALAVAAVCVGNVGAAVACVLLALLTACMWWSVQSRLPFAAANLSTACAALNAHPATHAVVFGSVVASCALAAVWVLAVVGIYALSAAALSNFAVYFALLVSLYWGGMVAKNVAHVTVCGAVASWWFSPADAQRPGAVRHALWRALTTSFGSICYGSLLIALLEAVRAVLRGIMNNKNGNGAARVLACCIECLLQYVEAWMKFLNKYAYVYVACFGDDFATAGRRVQALFDARGFWNTVVNDVVLDRVFGLGAFGIAVLAAFFGWGLAALVGASGGTAAAGMAALFGFLVGFLLAVVAMASLESAVATVYVAFAEEPRALQENHPGRFEALHEAWRHHYPEVAVAILAPCI
jgi:hypothetical protein